jgi:hypothetical protein
MRQRAPAASFDRSLLIGSGNTSAFLGTNLTDARIISGSPLSDRSRYRLVGLAAVIQDSALRLVVTVVAASHSGVRSQQPCLINRGTKWCPLYQDSIQASTISVRRLRISAAIFWIFARNAVFRSSWREMYLSLSIRSSQAW